MYNQNDLLKIIKQAAVNAVNASKPVHIVFGTVLNVSPLKIKIEQKLILESEQLILTRNVTNYKTSIVIDGEIKNITINNGLKINNHVLLVRMQEGQKYIVLDRIGG